LVKPTSRRIRTTSRVTGKKARRRCGRDEP
jgi:hypothetical protein